MAKKRPASSSAVQKQTKKTPAKTKASAKEELPHIVEPLRPLAVPLSEISPDARNARRHDESNLKAIRASLTRFGQRQPLVVNRQTGTILAGNARYLVAQDLGWSHVAVVYVEDDATAAAGYSLADNRTAELATWDDELLAELLAEIRDAETTEGADLVTELEWDSMLAEVETVGQQNSSSQALPEQWQVIANCQNEEQQKALYERLRGEGYDVTLLVT